MVAELTLVLCRVPCPRSRVDSGRSVTGPRSVVVNSIGNRYHFNDGRRHQ